MTMAGFGIPQLEIANLVGISDRTLRTRYRRELDTGATEANLRVAQSLYTLAVKDRNVSACIFWAKTRMGWREQDPNTASGTNHFVFSWADAPAPPAPQPAREAPTIDAAAEDTGGDLVVWQGKE